MFKSSHLHISPVKSSVQRSARECWALMTLMPMFIRRAQNTQHAAPAYMETVSSLLFWSSLYFWSTQWIPDNLLSSLHVCLYSKRMLKFVVNIHITQGEWDNVLKVTQITYVKEGFRQGLGDSFSSKFLLVAEQRSWGGKQGWEQRDKFTVT